MIRLHNVSKVYDKSVVALREVGLEVAKGEFVFLVGPSGSGKSTMLRLMMREERPDTGEVWVAGKHASSLPSWKVPHLRRSIGTVFQDFKLLPNKTVYENVSFALEVTGRSRHVVRTQVPQVLKLVGLSDKADRQPRQLSGGEQQRVSIARAFVNRPLILLADEPTGNLDPATSVGIMRILDRINRTGTTVVMATHDHAIVDAMRRRVVQLDDGRVIRDQRSGAYEVRVQSNVRRAEESFAGDVPEIEDETVPEVAEPATAETEAVESETVGQEVAETDPAELEPSDLEPATDDSADEKPADEDSADEKPADEDSADEKPADEDCADEDSADEEPADEPVSAEAVSDEDKTEDES